MDRILKKLEIMQLYIVLKKTQPFYFYNEMVDYEPVFETNTFKKENKYTGCFYRYFVDDKKNVVGIDYDFECENMEIINFFQDLEYVTLTKYENNSYKIYIELNNINGVEVFEDKDNPELFGDDFFYVNEQSDLVCLSFVLPINLKL